MVKEVAVLRLGHRIGRDPRATTHCCLVARALGAKEILITGDEDLPLKNNVDEITKEWGGKFKVNYKEDWKKTLKEHKGKGFIIAHLTMYGMPIQNKISEIRKKDKIMIVVGSQKVPREVYNLVDFNIAVTNQPHSEIAALAIALHELFEGKELENKFPNSKIKIVPMEKGKKTI